MKPSPQLEDLTTAANEYNTRRLPQRLKGVIPDAQDGTQTLKVAAAEKNSPTRREQCIGHIPGVYSVLVPSHGVPSRAED